MTYEGLKQLESFSNATDLTFGPPQRDVLVGLQLPTCSIEVVQI